jgi:hypothetical protein
VARARGFSLAVEKACDSILLLMQAGAHRSDHTVAGKSGGDSTFGLQDFFRDLLRSFVPSAYPQLAARAASSSALYLLGVAFVVTLLVTPVLYTFHERRLAAGRAHYERVLPEGLYFENGEAHYDGDQPYIHVENAGDTRTVLIIDTTGETTEIPDEHSYGALITNKTIVQKIDTGRGRTERVEDPIPQTAGRVTARQFYLDELEKRKWADFALGVGQFFLFAAVPLLILAAVAAALCFGLTAIRREGRLPFETCFAVTAHGATPVAFTTVSAPFAPTAVLSRLVLGVTLGLFVLLVLLGARACQRQGAARPEARGARSEARGARSEARRGR